MIQEIIPHSFHIEYKEEIADMQDLLLCYRKNTVLVKPAEVFSIPTVEMAIQRGIVSSVEQCQYLFSVDDTKFFCILEEQVDEFEDYHYVNVRWLRGAAPRWKAFAAVTGFQLLTWYRKNRFCGICGQHMIHGQKERTMNCPNCGNIVYPTIAPSVIVAVKDGDKLLLTRYQAEHSAYRNYALVAGYVETGETVEDTVRREVMEEVGLKVKNIQYYKSQPWSFTGALLLGFFCEVDGGSDIILDETELEEGIWLEREKVPVRSDDVSLTSEMMEQFRTGKIL